MKKSKPSFSHTWIMIVLYIGVFTVSIGGGIGFLLGLDLYWHLQVVIAIVWVLGTLLISYYSLSKLNRDIASVREMRF